MLSRTLVVAALCACAAASLTPLSAAGDDNDCALYLSGPGRTSSFDYSLNLLRGNFGYDGQHTCITYDAVNQAYLEARKRILVAQPKGDWKAEDYASVGELILDISINLARTYGLTYEEIEKGLPLIDTSRTLIRQVCPPVFSHVECRAGKYRRFDGLCNNLQHPTWGATMAPFQRLIGPLFADGINAPRISHSGRDLPLSRVVSRTMHPDDGFHDHAGTVMVIAWGQFMDHDYTLTATPLDPINRNDPEECCKRPPHLKHPYCNEIRVPDDDYFYRLFGVKCIDFVRGFPSPRPGCKLGSRIPFNTLTGAIDGNTVYGVTEKFGRKLRTGYGGLLRMNPVFKEYGLRDLLPLKLDIPDEGCTRPNKNMYCFEAGEIRVNEQLVLTVMHTLMAREHNRVAEGLAAVNPHWDDETLFQEARRINIAEIQHITYNEFLPILLGKDVMEKFGLLLEKDGYWDGYDPTINPDVIAGFAAAAYRFGHSLLPTAVERWSKAHKFIASKRLSDLIRRPYDLYRAGVLDEYVMGLMNQVAQAMDDSITQEVTNHLFKKVGARFGMDLVSFNMQRGREFGLPGYMEFRKFCGLPGANTFQDLFGSMPNETVRKYESIFEHPVDVDLWSGGVSERPLPGSMLGPTFACVIATQFSYSRRGDRFWFELPNQPSSFTPEQLKEIRKSRLARIICDNTDIIDTVQLYPMVLPDHELNPRVPCRSGIIPSMDFSKWAEPTPFRGAAKQFETLAQILPKNETVADIENLSCKSNNVTVGEKPFQCSNNTAKVSDDDTEVTQEKNIQDFSTVHALTDTMKLNSTDLQATTEIQNDCLKNGTDSKQTNKTDTVLTYLYKNDKINRPTKRNGHIKNSLKRKRRSIDSQKHEKHVSDSKNLPLIVNYDNIYRTKDREPIIPFQQNKANTIRGSDLADFNIETLHENIAKPNKSPHIGRKEFYIPPSTSSSRLTSDTYGSHDKEDYKNPKNYRNSEERIQNEKSKESFSYLSQNRKPEIRKNKPDSDDKDDSSSNSNESASRESKEATHQKSSETNENGEGSDESKFQKPDRSQESDRSIEEKSYDKYSSDSKENSRDDADKSNLSKNNDKSEEITPHLSYEKYSSDSKENSRENADKSSLTKNNDKSEETTSHLPYDKYSSDSKENSRENADKSSLSKNNDKSEKTTPHLSYDKYSSDSKENSRENADKSSLSKNNDKSEEITSYLDKHSEEERYPFQNKHNKDLRNFNNNILEKEEVTNKNSDSKIGDYSKENVNGRLNSSNPGTIQDIDLGDFSYERIKVNDKGEVEPLKETQENFDSNPSFNAFKSNETKNNGKYKENTEYHSVSQEETGSPSSHEISEESTEPIRINDGEIKPVVEINGEHYNDEFSKEDDAVEIINKEDFSNNNSDSKEALLSAQESSSKSLNDKKELQGDDNVKQQFERIPLNYNHDNKDENDTDTPSHTPLNTPNIKPDNELIDEIPFDPRTPKQRFDEDLKIKFNITPIKLPEIKLPEDILAYTYDEPSYQKYDEPSYQKSKNKEHKTDDDEDIDSHSYRNEKKENIKKVNEDDSTPNYNYRDYYGFGSDEKKQDYQKPQKNDDEEEEEHKPNEENVDLYEKFVQERFGKQGSFDKRSEKLQTERLIPEDPALYETIKNILKKTEKTHKEAENSGDPRAGYMWTLEYGEQL